MAHCMRLGFTSVINTDQNKHLGFYGMHHNCMFCLSLHPSIEQSLGIQSKTRFATRTHIIC